MKTDIYVIGRGKYFEKKKNVIKDYNYNIIAFFDNKPNDVIANEEFRKIPVLNVPDIKSAKKIPILIMVSSKYLFEIINQLFTLGVEESRIILGCNTRPDFDFYEKLMRKNKIVITCAMKRIILTNGNESYFIKDEKELQNTIRKLNNEKSSLISSMQTMPLIPYDTNFGYGFGTSISRYYVDRFICDNCIYIKGDVGEFTDLSYTNKYGSEIKNAYAYHVYGYGDTIKLNLETGEGVVDNCLDCLICTQTLQMIYDLKRAVKNIYRMLKKGGTVLVTTSGISQISMYDYNNWGEMWRFTSQSLKKLFLEAGFEEKNIVVTSFGNVKTAMCFLYGLSKEDLNETDFTYNDEQYQMICAARCIK